MDDVLDRYIQVTGGEESYLAYENSRMEGVIEIAAQGLRGEVFVYHEAPNRRRVVMTIPGIGEVIRVYNGEHGWEINPLLGPRVLTEDELSTEKIDSAFNGALYMDSLYPDREMVGANTFNGVNSWEIRLTTDTGNSRNVHYDQQTGLMLGMSATVPTDVITYGASISACEKGQQWQCALQLLAGMQAAGVSADVMTYSACISACGRGQQRQCARL